MIQYTLHIPAVHHGVTPPLSTLFKAALHCPKTAFVFVSLQLMSHACKSAAFKGKETGLLRVLTLEKNPSYHK